MANNPISSDRLKIQGEGVGSDTPRVMELIPIPSSGHLGVSFGWSVTSKFSRAQALEMADFIYRTFPPAAVSEEVSTLDPLQLQAENRRLQMGLESTGKALADTLNVVMTITEKLRVESEIVARQRRLLDEAGETIVLRNQNISRLETSILNLGAQIKGYQEKLDFYQGIDEVVGPRSNTVSAEQDGWG